MSSAYNAFAPFCYKTIARSAEALSLSSDFTVNRRCFVIEYYAYPGSPALFRCAHRVRNFQVRFDLLTSLDLLFFFFVVVGGVWGGGGVLWVMRDPCIAFLSSFSSCGFSLEHFTIKGIG